MKSRLLSRLLPRVRRARGRRSRVVGLECLGVAHMEQAKGGEQRKFVGLDHWIAWRERLRLMVGGGPAAAVPALAVRRDIIRRPSSHRSE